MDNINWLSEFVYFGLIVLFILSFCAFLVIMIMSVIKKKSIKKPVIYIITITLCFSIIGGGFALNDYSKDKWFYDFEKEITKQHEIVEKIDLSLGRVGVSLFVYCKENIDKEDIELVFKAIKENLFGRNPENNISQESYLKRGKDKYESIIIWFYAGKNERPIISYESDYYTDGLREKIDNFSTWRINE